MNVLRRLRSGPTTETWTNFAGDQSCRPATFERPSSQAEVARAIERARQANLNVRVAGGGHGFTDAVLTDGVLLSLERMNRILDVDRESGLVRAQSGITLGALSDAMHQHGLALANMGDIDVQSLAGATATGTHGTGIRLTNLSAGLVSIELTLADGSCIEVNVDNDPDAWRAARVSLGALGVVTAATVQGVPAFVLDAVETTAPMEPLLNDLDALLDENDHFGFFAFPHSQLAMTKTWNRTKMPRPRSRLGSLLHDHVLVNYAFWGSLLLARAQPRWIPMLNRLNAKMSGTTCYADRSHRVFVTPRKLPVTEMEYAIPREHAPEAVRRILALAEETRFHVPVPLEVRFVAPDDAFLSPAHARETCYVAVHQFVGMEWDAYFRAVEEIMIGYDGRPHWGKRHFQTAKTLHNLYPDWDRFQAVRTRLDPDGVFANAHIKRVLGDTCR